MVTVAIRSGGAAGGTDSRFNLSEEDIRQLTREARQYADDLNRLRGDLRNQDLRGAEIDPKQLDQMMGALRDLADPRVYKNVAELARLQAYVAEQAKRVDFALRREVEAAERRGDFGIGRSAGCLPRRSGGVLPFARQDASAEVGRDPRTRSRRRRK